MKYIRMFFSLLMTAAILLASAISAGAIGFDAEKAYDSVFVVVSGNSYGSGFAIGKNCIVTNAHVIDDRDSIMIMSYDEEKYEAFVLGMSEDKDIAVLAVNGASFPYLPVADMSGAKIGDDIYAIGAPKGMTYTLTKGSISAKDRMVSGKPYIQIDAAINAGNSGGPLLNDSGEVLGMNTMKMSDSEGIGLAIPIDRICEYIKSLGISLDTGGNIDGSVSAAETAPEETAPAEGAVDSERGSDHVPAITYVAAAVAALSIIGNIVLASKLAREKKKNKQIYYDPSERTDFDIDIWE